MKKGFIFGGAAIALGTVAYFLFGKDKKNAPEKQTFPAKEISNVQIKEEEGEDYFDILLKNDPLEDFRHRRALYTMARIQKCDIETEEGQAAQMDFISYFNQLDYDWNEVLVEVEKIPEHDDEAGRRDLRLFILLGRSRDAFYIDSVNSSLDTEELEETFSLIQSLDNLIEKWGL